jgi:hypothetical protein
MNLDPLLDYQTAIKDPGIYRSDSWDFPTNASLGIDWVGRVHRGTPWQTIFLKSTNILLQTGNAARDFQTWEIWSGDGVIYDWQPGQPFSYPLFDAFFTVPTNDWHLVSTLNALFNPNTAQQLVSVNQTFVQSWEALLNGITVLTNVSSAEYDPVLMSSNSPQSAIIARAILQNRFSQPGQFFRSIGDILSTAELSMASPWLNPTNPVTDEALEIIPSQLLPLLRPDSFATAALAPTGLGIQFTGTDGNNYSVQVSSNLVDWATIATNTPQGGFFNFAPPLSSAPVQFYRSRILP